MKSNFTRRVIVLLLAVILLVGLMPTSTFAATVRMVDLNWRYNTGSGLPGNLSNHSGRHIVKYVVDNGDNVAYCLEIGKALHGGDEVNVSSVWNALTPTQQNLLKLALKYGTHTINTALYGHTYTEGYVATQVMVWMIVNNAYNTSRESTIVNQLARNGSDRLLDLYNDIKANMMADSGSTLPSFASATSAVTFNEWTFDIASQRYTKTFTDTNNVLSGWSVVNKPSDVTITKSGNTLTVSSANPYTGGLTLQLQKTMTGGVNYWVGASSSVQRTATYDPVETETLNAYVGVKAVNARAQILKTTESKTGATNENLAGHKFRITGNGINPIDVTTDATGKTPFVDLRPGTYTITEIQASNPKYILAAPQTVTVQAGQTHTFSFHNTIKKGQIKVHKLKEPAAGSTQYEDFPGVTFNIYDNETGKLADSITTGADGTAISKLLYYGNYTVKEVAPAGYDPAPDWTVNVTEHLKIYEYKYIVNKIYQGSLKIVKVDKETGKEIARAGAKFKIYREDNSLVTMTDLYPTPVVLDTFETAADGTLRLPEKLPYGKYSLVEITAPIGYSVSSTPVAFTVEKANEDTQNIIVVKFEDVAVKGRVSVEKIGEQLVDVTKTDHPGIGTVYTPVYAEKPLAGVVFDVVVNNDVFSADNQGSTVYTKGTVVDTITTDINGKATSKDLPLGDYALVEKKTTDGFSLADEPAYFSLQYADQTTAIVYNTVTMSNARQRFEASFVKDMELGIGKTNKPFDQVVFGVFAKEDIKNYAGTVVIPKGSIVALETPGKDGKCVMQADLPFGSYYLQELKTATGYQLNDTKYAFELAYGNADTPVIKVSLNNGEAIKNDIIEGKGKVKKTDPSGKALPGAVFQVYTEDDYFVAEVESDKNGDTPEVELTYGKYYWVEIKAPAGCKLDKTKRYFEVTEEGKVFTVDVVNYYNDIPKTGDNNAIATLVSASFASMILLAGAYLYLRKRKDTIV